MGLFNELCAIVDALCFFTTVELLKFCGSHTGVTVASN